MLGACRHSQTVDVSGWQRHAGPHHVASHLGPTGGEGGAWAGGGGPAPSPFIGSISNAIYSLGFSEHMQRTSMSFFPMCTRTSFSFLVTLASFPVFMPLVSAARLTALARTSTTCSTSVVGSRHPFLFQTLMEKLLMVLLSFLRLPAGTSVTLCKPVTLSEMWPHSSNTLECRVAALTPALVCLCSASTLLPLLVPPDHSPLTPPVT